MEISRHAESLLRQAGYSTRLVTKGPRAVLCFEDNTVVGFLQVFGDVRELLSNWQAAEKANLVRHTIQLRSAPTKAWNVYSAFLTEDRGSPQDAAEVGRIEEDFSSTRKIARTGVNSIVELERALSPLLPLRNVTSFSVSDYEARLRARLNFLPRDLKEALLGRVDPAEIARLANTGS